MSLDLSVRPIESHEMDTWDEFVAGASGGTLFHTSTWKNCIDSAMHPGKVHILGCFAPRGLVGGCVFLHRSRYAHRVAVTPLLTPYSGYLLESPGGGKVSDIVTRQSAILESLGRWLMDRYSYQSFCLTSGIEDLRPLMGMGYRVTPRYSYLLNLKLPAEELWMQFDGNVRRQVKKAEAEDFELSDILPLDAGYSLFQATFSRTGGKCPVDRALYEAVVGGEALRGNRFVFCASRDGVPVSALVILSHGRTLYYSIAATDPRWRNSGVNSFLVWELVKRCANREWDQLDFVGANIPSIARFKEGFNPRLVPHFQVEYYKGGHLRLGRRLLDTFRR